MDPEEHQCLVQLYSDPPPRKEYGYRRIWVNNPTPHWEYRLFGEQVPLPVNPVSTGLSNIELLHWHFDNPGPHPNKENVSTLIGYVLEDLNIVADPDEVEIVWNSEYETWTPRLQVFRIPYLDFLRQNPSSIQQQLDRKRRDFLNYTYENLKNFPETAING